MKKQLRIEEAENGFLIYPEDKTKVWVSSTLGNLGRDLKKITHEYFNTEVENKKEEKKTEGEEELKEEVNQDGQNNVWTTR